MHVNPERLRAAWERARRGSKAAGIDGITPDLFAGVAEEQLNQLARLLAQERYCPQPILGVPIRKRGGRQRLLGIATVQDRIVQRWLLRALYPALEEALSPASYAYRPGCSIHQAVGTLRAYWKPWLLKADIAQFFDALAWPVLLAALDDLALGPPPEAARRAVLASGLGSGRSTVAAHPRRGARQCLIGGAGQFVFERVRLALPEERLGAGALRR